MVEIPWIGHGVVLQGQAGDKGGRRKEAKEVVETSQENGWGRGWLLVD